MERDAELRYCPWLTAGGARPSRGRYVPARRCIRGPAPTLVALFAAGLGTGWAGAAALAEEQAPPILKLEQALAMARKANRTLVAERARLAQARTNLETAWAALFPTVAAQGKYTRNNIGVSFPSFVLGGSPGAGGTLVIQPVNQLDGIISFTAPLLVPASVAALRAVKTGVQASELDYQTAEVNLLTTVAQAYFAAAISEEVLAARKSSIEVARATVDNAQTRFSVGAVTKVDVDRAELALVRAEQAEREARFGRDQAYRAVATLVQAPGAFKVEGLPPSQASSQPEELTTALQLRPEFRALTLFARAQVAQGRAYAWRWAPGLSAFGNARIFNYDNFAQQRHAWAIGLELDWLLFDGGTRDALRHAAAAQARQAEAQAAALRDAIRDDLLNTTGLLETKRRAHDAAERSVVLASETLALVRTQYEAGTIAQLDLLQAQDGLVAAKEALAQAHFELATADLGVRRAAGTFPGK